MSNKHNDEPPKWLVDFYCGLWSILKVVLIIGLIAIVLFLRVGCDRWYFNMLTK